MGLWITSAWGDMYQMSLPSRHRVRNSSPGGPRRARYLVRAPRITESLLVSEKETSMCNAHDIFWIHAIYRWNDIIQRCNLWQLCHPELWFEQLGIFIYWLQKILTLGCRVNHKTNLRKQRPWNYQIWPNYVISWVNVISSDVFCLRKSSECRCILAP